MAGATAGKSLSVFLWQLFLEDLKPWMIVDTGDEPDRATARNLGRKQQDSDLFHRDE